MAEQFDVIVIGGGPAGYVAAIRCAQLGLKTVCVDKWLTLDEQPALGGTCLNVGCIPSKALLESSHHYSYAKKNLATHGIKVGGVGIDVVQMINRKNQVVSQLTGGIAQLFKANKIEWIQAHGKLLADKRVEITPHNYKNGKKEVISGRHIILAAGSVPIDIPAAPIDHDRILDSADMLNLAEVPKTLAVIGAGVIGLEMASVWSRLGTEVILLEAMNEFLAAADQQIAKDALRHYKKQGLDIRLNTRVIASKVNKKDVTITYQNAEGEQELKVEKLLVAVGRKPSIENLIDPSVDILMDGSRIHVGEDCSTNIPGIWAIGDIVRGPMLAHKASEEGVAVAERIAGKYAHVNYDVIPWVIYTEPEIAWVGKTEEACHQEGLDIKIGTFPFAASGRAKAIDATDGLVKIITDARTDRIIGAHIVGNCASELIHELVVAMEFGASSEDVARIVHAHPTLSEAIHEAALAVDKRAIHIMNK